MRKKDRIEQLRRIPLFEDCSKRDLDFLATEAHHSNLEAGHVLFSEGNPSTNLYLILAGSVEVTRANELVGTVGPGDTVGELGLLIGRPRSATVTAKTPIEFLTLDKKALRTAMEVPGLGWKILRSVVERLAPQPRSTDPLPIDPERGRA